MHGRHVRISSVTLTADWNRLLTIAGFLVQPMSSRVCPPSFFLALPVGRFGRKRRDRQEGPIRPADFAKLSILGRKRTSFRHLYSRFYAPFYSLCFIFFTTVVCVFFFPRRPFSFPDPLSFINALIFKSNIYLKNLYTHTFYSLDNMNIIGFFNVSQSN